jgi:hypothetical protein
MMSTVALARRFGSAGIFRFCILPSVGGYLSIVKIVRVQTETLPGSAICDDAWRRLGRPGRWSRRTAQALRHSAREIVAQDEPLTDRLERLERQPEVVGEGGDDLVGAPGSELRMDPGSQPHDHPLIAGVFGA